MDLPTSVKAVGTVLKSWGQLVRIPTQVILICDKVTLKPTSASPSVSYTLQATVDYSKTCWSAGSPPREPTGYNISQLLHNKLLNTYNPFDLCPSQLSTIRSFNELPLWIVSQHLFWPTLWHLLLHFLCILHFTYTVNMINFKLSWYTVTQINKLSLLIYYIFKCFIF